ncbi:MAG: ECF-type sigma factor [Rhodothermales bacterium]
MPSNGQITALLQRYKAGDEEALESIVPIMYDELYEVARQHMQREFRKGHTLSATALVNEAYLKLARQHDLDASHRCDFMAIASRTMRNILVDHARSKKRLKRGAGQAALPLDEAAFQLTDQEASEVLELDAAIDRLAALNERASEVVQFRFYGGLTVEETAEVMNISERSVQRAWTVAKAWLRKEVSQHIG